MTPTKQTPAEAPADDTPEDAPSVANELDAPGADDAQPFGMDDEQMSATDIAAYIAAGFPGVAIGAQLGNALDGMPEIIDQTDLDGQPFALLDVRHQPKTIVIPEHRDEAGAVVPEQRITEYTMVVCAVQPVELDTDGRIADAGAIFIMVAGRDNSVFGREMAAAGVKASPSKPLLFPWGIREVQLGSGWRYYTARPEQAKRGKPVLFPKRAAAQK